MQRYTNNQQKIKAKKPVKYTKTKPYHPTLRTAAPEKITWYLVYDHFTFHPGYFTGSLRLKRM